MWETSLNYSVIRDENRTAVFRTNGINVIITEKRTPFHHIADFEKIGIHLPKHKRLVVKLGYLVPELKAIADESFLALSPGAVNQDLPALPYCKIRRPMYPLNPDMEWDPTQELRTVCPR